MNFYVDVISKAVDYIEDSLGERLSLSILSQQFGISDFHFNRIFKTVTGTTLKQYILGRKLTKALELLRQTDHTVIDIAMDLGFDYPEVFSRAFSKHFGISPAQFREADLALEGLSRACVIERDIINYRGVLALKGNCQLIEEHSIWGEAVEADVNQKDFEKDLRLETERIIRRTSENDVICQTSFYTVVSCHGEDNGLYTVFCGRKVLGDAAVPSLHHRIIPGGWYIDFKYNGDMFEIRETFVDDLYRWIMVKEAELNPNGIGMINIYHSDYPCDKEVRILIPVKKPV